LFGRTTAEAFQRYVDTLHRTLACVTRTQLVGEGHKATERPHPLNLGRGAPAALRSNMPGVKLGLTVFQLYTFAEDHEAHIDRRWSVVLAQYAYHLYRLDAPSEQEIVLFHWHPNLPEGGARAVLFPHIHIGTGELAGRDIDRRHHIPSGWIGLEAVLEYAIVELDARPLNDSYAEIFAETRAEFERLRM
jgi:hypothetical protein